MRKFVNSLIIVICFLWVLVPQTVEAAVIDPTIRGEISIYYKKDGDGFEGLEINAYRVAEIKSDGTFELLEPFTRYPVTIDEMLSKMEWQTVANTLASYVEADQLESYCMIGTDENGTVVMDHMESGLYLIPGMLAQKGEKTYEFADFFVSLPSKMTNGIYSYHVEIKPKSALYVPPTDYKVVKLWKDSENSDKRPVSVEIDIIKDGIVSETVTLNAENQWTYEWKAPAGEGSWTVIEKNVAENYRVEISVYEDTFQITNTYHEENNPEDPTSPKDPEKNKDSAKPKDSKEHESLENQENEENPAAEVIPPEMPSTGDQAPVLRYVLIACAAGIFLFMFGIYRSRRKDDETKD